MPDLVHRYDAPPWLPPGSTAEVWRATSSVVPEPVCVTRVLVTDEQGRILVVEREDRGLDIPSTVVGGRELDEVLDDLARSVPILVTPPVLLGWVRNVVAADAAQYPWPAPYAHFAVWTARTDAPAAGRWLHRTAAEAALGRRHWWPLTAHALP